MTIGLCFVTRLLPLVDIFSDVLLWFLILYNCSSFNCWFRVQSVTLILFSMCTWNRLKKRVKISSSFHHLNSHHLNTISKIINLYLLSEAALDTGGGGPDSLIERSPYLPPVAHKIAPQYFYFLLLQNHQRVPYLRTFQDIMRLISIFLLPPGIVQWADSWQSPTNLERRLESTYHPLRRDIRCRW